MALDLFRVTQGLNIELDDLSKNASVLVGDGLPGGDASYEDAAPIGSIFLRTDAESNSLQLYYKHSTANNSSADWKVTASQDYVDAVAQGLSWREPVLVHDATTYADITAAETAANVGDTVDGITITAGSRILFSDLTTGNDNVYIVSGSSGAWTFTEDTNAATDGDALLVQQGTYAEQQWVFDGTSWVQFGSGAAAAELGYIRTFIGKTGPGSELPTYSSTEIVAQSSNLETAIGALDAAAGTGEITNDGGNYSLSDDMSWAAAGTLTITSALDELNEGIGDATFTSSGTNITNGDSANTSINNLNEAIIPLQEQSLEISGTQSATVLTTMDTIPVAEATQVKWMVQVRATGTPANRRGVEIHAMTDGTSVDHSEYAILKLGSPIAGLDFNVAISGVDIILTVNSTPGVDYVVKRISYSAF